MSWKREEISDHKFDYVDVDEFIDNSLSRRMAYSTVFIFAIKDILVYMADLASAAILISANKATLFENRVNATIIFNTVDFNDVSASKENQNTIIQALGGPTVILALILASLVASFLLLAFEWRKAQKIIKSRDISYAFTSQVAYSYYTIRSYPHYCFFSQIQNSRKPVDVLAFWVFFKFRGWKRLILAEFPRQFLNALILYDIFQQKQRTVIQTVQKLIDLEDKTVLVFVSLQLVTVTIWIISFLGLFIAFVVYIPLLCNIRGNLKEYCVHKIDKRYKSFNFSIGEILKRKTRKRLQDARRLEQEKIETTDTITNQPTLPQVDVDLDSEFDSYQYPSEYGSEVGGGYYGQYAYQQGYQGYAPSSVSGYANNQGYAPSSVSGYAQNQYPSAVSYNNASYGGSNNPSGPTQGQYRRRPS